MFFLDGIREMPRDPRNSGKARTSGLADKPDKSELIGLKVLVVDDDIVDFEALQRALKRMESYHAEADWAKNPEKARYFLKSKDYDVVFVDYHLGLNTGSKLLQELGGREARHVSILITGLASKHVQQMALMAGAIHCMSKDEIDPRSIETAIRYALFTHALEQRLYNQLIEHKQAQHQLEQQIAQISHIAEIDSRELLKAAEQIEQSMRSDRSQSVIFEQVAHIRNLARQLLRMSEASSEAGGPSGGATPEVINLAVKRGDDDEQAGDK